MKTNLKSIIKDSVITLIIIASAFGISIALQDVFNIWEQITTLFVFAVYLISLVTDGYVYGIVATFAAVLAINYAFTYPYFYFDFSASASIFSAIVMLILSLLTSTFTTKLKRWQSIRSESEKEMMRANLLRAVSHDLRTPLTTIYGASESVIENYDKLTDAQKLQIVGGIKEDSEWLIRIVENLLSVTRIDSGNVKLIKTPTVLEELLDSVILKFKKRYPSQSVELDIPEQVVIIPMDAILIEQVLINILENAVHHAKGFTKLTLRVFVIDGKAIFEISDDGCGIEKEKLPHLFSGLSALEGDIFDSHERNAGIGLSVCSTIVKAHGGSITAGNLSLGGAVFRFSLDTQEDSCDE